MSLSLTTKPLDELGDPNAPIGSRPWLLYVANEIRKTLYDKEQTGRRLQDLVEVFKEHAGWQEFGYLTWEEYCAKRLQTEAEKIESEVARRAEQAKPPLTHEEAGKLGGRGNKATDNSKELYGNSAQYLADRIGEVRPDILEGMKAGKYRSVRQAAIEAGIVSDKTR